MCLLQVSHQENNITAKSMSLSCACTCSRLLADPLSKHSDLISKTEFEADMKSKYSKARNCSWNIKNQKKNKKKMEERMPHRGRRHGHHDGTNNTNQSDTENKAASPTDQQPPIYDESWLNGTDTVDNVMCSDNMLSRLPKLSDLPSSGGTSPNGKMKVHFNEEHLTEIIEFPDDDDSKDMRKIYWEFFHVDRIRFKDRVIQAESILESVLKSDHRDRIYSQRFQEPSSPPSSSSPSPSSFTPLTTVEGLAPKSAVPRSEY